MLFLRRLKPWLALAMASMALAAGISAGSTGQELAESAGASLIGKSAPRLTLKTIDGVSVDLGDLYGKKAVYLKFWATWCAECREQMPHFQGAFHHAGADLAVIAVDVGFNDSPEEVKRYRRSAGLTMPIVMDDGRLAAALNLRVTPQHVVIGRDGRIQYIGHLVDDRLETALLKARRPATASSSAPVAVQVPTRLAVGDRLPEMSVATIDGRTFAMSDPEAKRPTAIVFLSPWCESYLAESRPQTSAACRSAREKVALLSRGDRIRWLGIGSGLWADVEDLTAYRDERQITMPLALDESGALFRQFAIASVPAIVLVDAHARIVRRLDPAATSFTDELAALAHVDETGH